MTELKLAWFLEAIFKRRGLCYGRGLCYYGRVSNAYFFHVDAHAFKKNGGQRDPGFFVVFLPPLFFPITVIGKKRGGRTV